jgi:hypothetical protein
LLLCSKCTPIWSIHRVSKQLVHAVHPQAHTNVDVRVDIPAFRALLADRLPLVFAGWPVEAAAIPWPVQEGAEEAELAEAEAAERA